VLGQVGRDHRCNSFLPFALQESQIHQVDIGAIFLGYLNCFLGGSCLGNHRVSSSAPTSKTIPLRRARGGDGEDSNGPSLLERPRDRNVPPGAGGSSPECLHNHPAPLRCNFGRKRSISRTERIFNPRCPTIRFITPREPHWRALESLWPPRQHPAKFNWRCGFPGRAFLHLGEMIAGREV
jgi:hypothetical protein